MNLIFSEYYYGSLFAQYPNDIQNISPRSDIDASLSLTSEALSPQDHLVAERLAREMLLNNGNCCRVLF